MSERERKREGEREREEERESWKKSSHNAHVGDLREKCRVTSQKVCQTHTHIQPHPDLATHTHTHTWNTLGILCVFQMDYKMLGKLFSNVPLENFH